MRTMTIQWSGGPRNLHADEMEHFATLFRRKLNLAPDAPVIFRVPPCIYWSPNHLPFGITVEQFPTNEIPKGVTVEIWATTKDYERNHKNR